MLSCCSFQTRRHPKKDSDGCKKLRATSLSYPAPWGSPTDSNQKLNPSIRTQWIYTACSIGSRPYVTSLPNLILSMWSFLWRSPVRYMPSSSKSHTMHQRLCTYNSQWKVWFHFSIKETVKCLPAGFLIRLYKWRSLSKSCEKLKGSLIEHMLPPPTYDKTTVVTTISKPMH